MANKLPEVYNQNCKNCSKEIREKITEQGLCRKTYSEIDELPVRCVGEWAKEKIHTLTRYFGIFTCGMKNQWPGLNYIEICSGPGRCIERESGLEFDGTSLAILNHKSFKLIKNAIFIDLNNEVVSTLNKRIEIQKKSLFAKAIVCDYNNIGKIKSILKELTPHCLNLVLLDPTDCSIPFSLIDTIKSSLKNTDFIINLALGTDLKRNLRSAIHNKHYSSRNKYLKFLGSDDFFNRSEVIEKSKLDSEDTLIKLFLDEYKQNLLKIGFKYFDLIPVKHYYSLLFTSKNETGLKFWHEANNIELTGQYNIRFVD